MKNIDFKADFQRHITELIKPNGATVPHNKIIEGLLQNIQPVDFRALAGLDKDEKLANNHLQIITVEQLLKIAKANRWGLCYNNEKAYLYNGAFWQIIDERALADFLGKAAEKMGVERYKARHFLFRENLLKQFNATAHLPKPEPDHGKIIINLSNGTFEISPAEVRLRAFDRNDFITYQLPFSYEPEASSPIFEKYLRQVLPDESSRRVLAEYLASVFITNETLKLEKSLMLFGTGANGKSVFYEIATALLGAENVSSYSLQSLTDRSGYYRSMIENKLLNYCSEISTAMQTEIFKQLASGEPLEARLPYGKPFTVRNYAKMIFNLNELPKDIEHSNAYFRRFLIVPFPVTIPEADQDKQLSQKIIKAELPAVFNWVLAGLQRLLHQKNFTPCKAADMMLESFKLESDSVQLFLTENNYQSSPDEFLLIKELYSDYRAFCADDGAVALKKTNFIKRLKAHSITTERRNVGNVAYLSKNLEF
jgi:putative DNA primase/helicase